MPSFATTRFDCFEQVQIALDRSQHQIQNILSTILIQHKDAVNKMAVFHTKTRKYNRLNPKHWELALRNWWNLPHEDILTDEELNFVNSMLKDSENLTRLVEYLPISNYVRCYSYQNGVGGVTVEFKFKYFQRLDSAFTCLMQRKDRYTKVSKWKSEDVTISQEEWDELSS